MKSAVVAFEGAEGYGASTVGGRGGAIVHVTNLADNGIGSLRWALEQLDYPRTVVFDVGGTIQLKDNILIQHGNVTIAGQTAPGGGITLSGAGIRVKADEVIMRGMHIRPGDGEGKTPDDRDALMIGTTDFTIDNVIVDHNTFTWAIDENVAINGKVNNISFTNNIVAEGLSKSLHSKGEHSKGLLISNWGGTDGGDNSNITIAKNLLSDNMQRNAEIRSGQNIEYINNYIYNYGLSHIGMYVGGGTNGTLVLDVDVIGNVWEPGKNTGNKTQPIMLAGMADGSQVALADNIYSRSPVDASGNQNQAGLYTIQSGQRMLGTVTQGHGESSNIGILDSSTVKEFVLTNAGAVNGLGRDSVDIRIISEAANGTGTIIDRVSQVYDITTKAPPAAAAADSDRDGMPDWFEDMYAFDKRVADDKGDHDADGFTNIEEYINGIISGFNAGPARSVKQAEGDFRLKAATLDTPVELVKFPAGGGVQVDLTAVFKTMGAEQNLADVVEIAYANSKSFISVNSNGAPGASPKTLVAIIDGVKISLADLTINRSEISSAGVTTSAPEAIVIAPPPVFDPHNYVIGTTKGDIFTIKDDLDRVVEIANGGTDIAVSYVDYMLDSNVENLSLKGVAVLGTGNELNNKISGNDKNNVLRGLDGDDRISGGNGNDRVFGDNGNDWVEGNAGNDMLWGGTGADVMYGGAGRDYFCFSSGDGIATKTGAQDRIADFCAEDVFVLNGMLIDLSTLASGQANKYSDAFVVASKIIAGAPDMAVIHGSKDSWLFWDENGDGVIEAGVTMTNAALTKSAWYAPTGDLPMI